MPEGTGGPRRFHACACGNRQVCPKFLDAFGVSICSVCKADESLVSKVGPPPASPPLPPALPPPRPPRLPTPPAFLR